MTSSLSPSVVGKAGELRVASELLLRGFRPLLSVVDDGVDITLVDGTTIQVKTAQDVVYRGGNTRTNFYYCFTLHGPRRFDRDGKVRKNIVTADFMVLFGVADNLFYIIPKRAVEKRHSIMIAPDRKRRSMWDKYKDAWVLLEKD